jgi:hypothetical protein
MPNPRDCEIVRSYGDIVRHTDVIDTCRCCRARPSVVHGKGHERPALRVKREQALARRAPIWEQMSRIVPTESRPL